MQTFSEIITENYLYIDKTKTIYDLISRGKTYFFSRPRRFGKSLLISTLECIFLGKKELFNGLWIYDQPWKWTPYPVIRIDFSLGRVTTPDELKIHIKHTLQKIAKHYDVVLPDTLYDLQFSLLIEALATQGKVVILIDEYDKPILDHIHNIEMATEMREILKGFYSVIKSSDHWVRFVFLTGVSKFSRVGVFSGINNLNDITMDARYTDLLGYTQQELEYYFEDRLADCVSTQKTSKADLLAQIKRWYNGYRFSEEDIRVYNPFSTLLFFDKLKFRNYWFETGTPTFLLKLIKEKDYDVQCVENLSIGEQVFSSYEIEDLRVEPLLYQTGYLTIKDVKTLTGGQEYILGYPNLEVKDSFLKYLMDMIGNVPKEFSGSVLIELIDTIEKNEIDRFMGLLKFFFVNIPYDLQLKHERYYQTIFYIIFTLIGLYIQAEVRTNQGRIDAVICTKNFVYIFEFKLFGTKEDALAQIREKKYAEKYVSLSKKLC